MIGFLVVLTFPFISCNTQLEDESVTSETRYTEQHRPQFHFSPDSMWMNDPNGMVFFKAGFYIPDAEFRQNRLFRGFYWNAYSTLPHF